MNFTDSAQPEEKEKSASHIYPGEPQGTAQCFVQVILCEGACEAVCCVQGFTLSSSLSESDERESALRCLSFTCVRQRLPTRD